MNTSLPLAAAAAKHRPIKGKNQNAGFYVSTTRRRNPRKCECHHPQQHNRVANQTLTSDLFRASHHQIPYPPRPNGDIKSTPTLPLAALHFRPRSNRWAKRIPIDALQRANTIQRRHAEPRGCGVWRCAVRDDTAAARSAAFGTRKARARGEGEEGGGGAGCVGAAE